MPKIRKKNSARASTNDYIYRLAEDLVIKDEKGGPDRAGGAVREEEEEPQQPVQRETPEEREIRFSKIQAEQILRDARDEAEEYKAEARKAVEEELDELRKSAQAEGYDKGYAAGMAIAMKEGKEKIEDMAKEQIRSVEIFLEAAARERDRLLDRNRMELKDLALTIAEKVIRVSLKNSSDIILRMVDAATDTRKRCEWARVYVADCDVRGKAYTIPELTAALGHIANRVRVVPMADDESGTVIVEMPDVILDASVSTQLGNIREVLDSAGLDGGR